MRRLACLIAFTFFLTAYASNHTPPKEGVRLMDTSGKILSSTTAKEGKPLKLKFGVWGKQVSPAGMGDNSTGHHHILIYDRKGKKGHKALPKGKLVPVSKTAIHFGRGQTHTELEGLKAGHEYEITLQFADRNHITYDPKIWSHSIRVKVE